MTLQWLSDASQPGGEIDQCREEKCPDKYPKAKFTQIQYAYSYGVGSDGSAHCTNKYEDDGDRRYLLYEFGEQKEEFKLDSYCRPPCTGTDEEKAQCWKEQDIELCKIRSGEIRQLTNWLNSYEQKFGDKNNYKRQESGGYSYEDYSAYVGFFYYYPLSSGHCLSEGLGILDNFTRTCYYSSVQIDKPENAPEQATGVMICQTVYIYDDMYDQVEQSKKQLRNVKWGDVLDDFPMPVKPTRYTGEMNFSCDNGFETTWLCPKYEMGEPRQVMVDLECIQYTFD